MKSVPPPGRGKFPLPRAWPTVCLLLAGAAAVACAEPEQLPATGQAERPIMEGVLSERDAVVYVRGWNDPYPTGCSGTLVAPNLVATARHCVSYFAHGEYVCTIDGDLDASFVRTPTNAGEMGFLNDPDQVTVFAGQVPDFSAEPSALVLEVIAPEAESICKNDLAFLVLDRDLEVTLPALRYGSGLIPGETFTVAGYGTNEEKRTERREKPGLSLQGAGPSEFYSVEGHAPPRTFKVGRGPCEGDSGGPAFSEKTGELVGVFTIFQASDCTSTESFAYYTQVAAFGPVIDQAFAKAGYTELLVPDVGPSASGGGPASGGTSGAEGGQAGDAATAGAGGRDPGGAVGAGGCSVGSRKQQSGWAGIAVLFALALLGVRRRSRLSTTLGMG